MPIWNRKSETMDRSAMQQLQLELLQTTVNRVYRNVPFYHRKFEQLGIAPEEVQSLEDISKLPFTTKDDLRDGYPYEMFAVPLREIVRIHSSSGAAAKPVVVGYTRNDLKHWADQTARVLSAAGLTKDDVVHIAFDYGLFTGGFGMHDGAQRLAANPVSAALVSEDRPPAVGPHSPPFGIRAPGGGTGAGHHDDPRSQCVRTGESRVGVGVEEGLIRQAEGLEDGVHELAVARAAQAGEAESPGDGGRCQTRLVKRGERHVADVLRRLLRPDPLEVRRPTVGHGGQGTVDGQHRAACAGAAAVEPQDEPRVPGGHYLLFP